MSYLIHLQQFEGPLGLLLYLIRKEEMDIMNINIGEITRQYLDYIRMMKELDLEVAGEFVAMAATLIHIKSRMLLPQYDGEGEEVEQEDPRKELVQKLLDYQKYQEAAKNLYARPLLNRDVFARGIREDLRDSDGGLFTLPVLLEEDGLYSLIASYRRVVRKAERAVHRVRPRVQSIASRIMEMADQLRVGVRVIMRDLVNVKVPMAKEIGARTQLLVTFLSLLELGRMGFVSLFQNETYGDIYIEAKRPIENDVVERVQEFEAMGSEEVSRAMIEEAKEEAKEESRVDAEAAAPIGEESSIDAELAQFQEVEDFNTADMATDDEILQAESELLSLLQSDEVVKGSNENV